MFVLYALVNLTNQFLPIQFVAKSRDSMKCMYMCNTIDRLIGHSDVCTMTL